MDVSVFFDEILTIAIMGLLFSLLIRLFNIIFPTNHYSVNRSFDHFFINGPYGKVAGKYKTEDEALSACALLNDLKP